MAPKNMKAMSQFLERNGYVYDRTNSRQADIYVHPVLGEFRVGSSISDAIVKNQIRNLQKRLGQTSDRAAVKRDAKSIKERQSVERDRLAEERSRRQAELAAYEAEQESRLDGMSQSEWSAVWREIERRQNEIRELERLMQEGPWNNKHEGRTRGARRPPTFHEG